MPELSNSASTTFRRAITGAVMVAAAAFGSSTGHTQTQPASVTFTPVECKFVTNLLLDEMEHWKSRPGDPDSVMTKSFMKSAPEFIGLDRKQIVCDGQVINWVTRGDKAILSAVAIRIDDLERLKKIPTKKLTDKFISVIGKSAQSASLEPSPK
jgi:hypothetical protein